MKKVIFVLVLAIVSIQAQTLAALEKKSEPLLVKGEYTEKDFYTVKNRANLRGTPEIKNGNIEGKGDGKKHLILKCEGDWCQLYRSGLWVHQSQIK